MKPEKIAERVFRGIHFIRIQDLPAEQAVSIREFLNEDQIIKIMINREIIPDCVQYQHYEKWYKLYLAVDEKKAEALKNSESRQDYSDPKVLRPSY